MTKPLTILARLLITAIFLMSAVGNKIPNYSAVAKYMESEGVPAPQVLLAGAIVFLIVGSVSLILGCSASCRRTVPLRSRCSATPPGVT